MSELKTSRSEKQMSEMVELHRVIEELQEGKVKNNYSVPHHHHHCTLFKHLFLTRESTWHSGQGGQPHKWEIV